VNALEYLSAADPLIGSAFAEDDALRARVRAAVLAIPFVVLYTLLVGASPSSLRAALMVLALLAARIARRRRCHRER